jgi:hypothetical protein
MDITTTTDIQDFMGWSTNATRDAWLATAITRISARFEAAIGRGINHTSRTELFDVDGVSKQTFRVKAYPITSITSITSDYERDFTGDAVSSDDYTFDAEAGLISIDKAFLDMGQKSLQIVYQGGMGANQSALESNHPDIVDAITKQVAFEYESRKRLGVTSVTDPAGNTLSYSSKGWLPEAEEAIARYKRRTGFAL